MQQGRTGCKRQSKAPLPAPGACTGRDVQGERLFLPPSGSTEKHAWMAWQSPRHTAPAARTWICATTTRSWLLLTGARGAVHARPPGVPPQPLPRPARPQSSGPARGTTGTRGYCWGCGRDTPWHRSHALSHSITHCHTLSHTVPQHHTHSITH